jgi:hypothetical protein
MGCISFTSQLPAVTTLNLYQPLQNIQILCNINLAKELKINHRIIIMAGTKYATLCKKIMAFFQLTALHDKFL